MTVNNDQDNSFFNVLIIFIIKTLSAVCIHLLHLLCAARFFHSVYVLVLPFRERPAPKAAQGSQAAPNIYVRV